MCHWSQFRPFGLFLITEPCIYVSQMLGCAAVHDCLSFVQNMFHLDLTSDSHLQVCREFTGKYQGGHCLETQLLVCITCNIYCL